MPGIRCVIAVALALPLAIWYIPQLIGRPAAEQPPQQPLLQASDLGTGSSANAQPAGQTAASLVADHVHCWHLPLPCDTFKGLKEHMRISADDAPAGVHGAAAAPAVIVLPHTGISLRGKSQAGGSESPAPQPAAIESITAGDGDQTAAAPSAGKALDQSATPADEQSPSKHNRTAAGTHLAPHCNVSMLMTWRAHAALHRLHTAALHTPRGVHAHLPAVPTPSLRRRQWHCGRRALEVLAAGGAAHHACLANILPESGPDEVQLSKDA